MRHCWPMRIALLLLLLVAPAWAQGPFPAPDSVSAIAGRPVTFDSASPFVPAEAPGAPTRAQGTLFVPPRSGTGRRPAVVMLHGSGGVLEAREHTYGRQFASLGIVALAVDSFAARRDRGVGFVDRLLNITETMLVADAFAALRYLAARPDVDPRRVALIGFSYGGMATVAAMNEGLAARLAPGGERFAAHAAYYGPCVARFADPRTTGAPLIMLWGSEDELMIPERCAAMAEELRRGGSAVETVVYPGAAHQWDGGWGPRRIGRLLGGCDFRLNADGTVSDLRTGLTMGGVFTRRLILGWCTEDKPYLLAADPAVRARSNAALAAFLDRALGTGLRRGGSAG